MTTQILESDSTPIENETPHSCDPDRVFADFEFMQDVMYTDNKRVRSLSHELATTLAKVYTDKEHPHHADEWIGVIERKYGRRLLMSLIKYLDDVLETANPLMTGLSENGSHYLCDVYESPSGPVYTGRSDAFVIDANLLLGILADADHDQREDGKSQIIVIQEDNHSECRRILKDCLANEPATESILLKPHQIITALHREAPSLSTEDKKNDHTEWRRSLVDVLARIQNMIDKQNKHGWKLSASEALGVRENADPEIRTYIDDHLTLKSLKDFLRGGLFDRNIRRKIKESLTHDDESMAHSSKSTAEGVVDRMISRHLTEQVKTLLQRPTVHDDNERHGQTSAVQVLFAENCIHLLDLLGRGIGRRLGFKLSPLNEDHEPLRTHLDERYGNKTGFDARIIPYLDIADNLVGTISLIKDFRALFKNIRPLLSFSSPNKHPHQPGVEVPFHIPQPIHDTLPHSLNHTEPIRTAALEQISTSGLTLASPLPRETVTYACATPAQINTTKTISRRQAPLPINIEDIAF